VLVLLLLPLVLLLLLLLQGLWIGRAAVPIGEPQLQQGC